MSRAEQFPLLSADRLERWSRFGNWDTVWFPQFLGLVVEEIREDYARMRLPYRPEFRQPAGVIHGGVLASMIDTVVVPAVGSGYDEPRQLFTIDLQLRYLAPISDEDTVAEGWVVKRGRQIVFCDAEVRAASGALAATGTLVYKVSSRAQTF
ncbi:MAG: PaaI family thioesterase [Actinomycetota bacterium]